MRDAEHAVAQDERQRDRGRGRGIDREADQVDAADAVDVAGGLGQLDLGDDAVVDQDVADRAAGALGLVGGALQRDRVGAPTRQRVEQWAIHLIHAGHLELCLLKLGQHYRQ